MNDDMSDSGQQPATKADLSAFATKSDLHALTNVFATKADLNAFMTKTDFAEFRVELREELRVMFRPILATLATHTVELADIRGKMVTRDEFRSRMDAFAGRVDDFDYSSAKNRSRLDDHEKRISALEEKRA